MTLPSRSAALLTVALAAVCGAVAGGAAFLLRRPAPPVLPAPETAERANAPDEANVPEAAPSPGSHTTGAKAAPSSNDDAMRPRVGGRTEREEFGRRLDSTDPEVAYGAALEAMLAGPSRLGFLRGVDPPTDRGQELLTRMIVALERLDQQQRHKVYGTLWDDKRLELRQEALQSVIPDAYLDAQNEEYYAAKVERDRQRFEMGNIEQGELYLTEVLLAGTRVRRGKIGAGELAALLETREDVIARWLEKAEESTRFAGRRFLRIKERYEALRSL